MRKERPCFSCGMVTVVQKLPLSKYGTNNIVVSKEYANKLFCQRCISDLVKRRL